MHVSVIILISIRFKRDYITECETHHDVTLLVDNDVIYNEDMYTPGTSLPHISDANTRNALTYSHSNTTKFYNLSCKKLLYITILVIRLL